jgi:hypothetical protein
MTTNSESYSRPLCEVITVPDPDIMPVASHVEQGGTLQWRTDTHNYSKFEIRFAGANPSNDDKDLILAGDDLKPVTIRLKTAGDYEYVICQYNKDETCRPIEQHRLFRVTPCGLCP